MDTHLLIKDVGTCIAQSVGNGVGSRHHLIALSVVGGVAVDAAGVDVLSTDISGVGIHGKVDTGGVEDNRKSVSQLFGAVVAHLVDEDPFLIVFVGAVKKSDPLFDQVDGFLSRS